MLKRFRVSNYRGFGNGITLDLGNPRDYTFNAEYITEGVVTNALVIGENASGKTNLIKAIHDVATNHYTPGFRSIAPDDDTTFMHADSTEMLARFEYTFLLQGHTVIYEYAKGPDRVLTHERLTLDRKTVFDYENSTGTLNDSSLDLVGAEALNWKFAADYASALSYLSSNAPVDRGGILDEIRLATSRISSIEQDGLGSSSTVTRCLRDIIRNGRVADLERFLGHFGIDERLRVHEDADGSKAIFCEYRRPVPFVSCMSSGTRTLVFLFYIYEMGAEGGLFLLDEFDAYCHFGVAEKLIRYFGSVPNRQTISTTHNTSLTRNDVMRPDCIFKIGDGYLAPLSELTSRELRIGNNIERLLRAGEFD